MSNLKANSGLNTMRRGIFQAMLILQETIQCRHPELRAPAARKKIRCNIMQLKNSAWLSSDLFWKDGKITTFASIMQIES